jgi:hypothetical protein
MYCQSCQTKLTSRDQSCPTCGRRAPGGRDLGSGAGATSGSAAYPLPPAQSLDEDSLGQSGSQSPSQSGSQKPRRAEPPARPAAAKEPPPARRAGRKQSGRAARNEPDFSVRPEDVRRMIVEQPGLIEEGLRVYSQEGEPVGAGFATAVGEIDLLARDSSGTWVVVAVTEPGVGKEIVGELLQRMGWVRRHLGKSGEEVRGIVLLDSLPDDLGYAAAAVSDSVEFKLYQVELTLESVIV